MKGVTIRDCDPRSSALCFDLRDILSVLGNDSERSSWTIREVECLGGVAASTLHRASDMGELLPGRRLIDLARDVEQIVDGTFSGRLPSEAAEWIVIRAVDSTAFDVQTDREDVLDRIKATFAHVEDLAE